MNTRIALLFAVTSLFAGSVAAEPVTKPVDPNQAPVAAVDRFSDKAAHLQLRTPDNHIPGPNQPVDFDTGPFITQGLSPTTGKPVRYYNFDVQTTTPAPVYVLYREGEDKPGVKRPLSVYWTIYRIAKSARSWLSHGPDRGHHDQRRQLEPSGSVAKGQEHRPPLGDRFGALEWPRPPTSCPGGQAPPSALGARAGEIYTPIVRQWKPSISRCSNSARP